MLKEIEYTAEELATEEWRHVNIPEYHDFYMVSNLGRVKSLPRRYIRKDGIPGMCKGGILKATNRNSLGYYGVDLCAHGNKKIYYVHRLVAITFIPNDDPKNKIMVNHIDENSRNNRVNNLAWVTPKENSNWGTQIQRRWKPVARLDSKTGEVIDTFNSIKEAAELFDIPSSSISVACTTLNKTLYGYKWTHL